MRGGRRCRNRIGRHKKAPPERGLLGRQRAGNHPSPHSVNKLRETEDSGESVEQEQREACGDGDDGKDQGPADNGYKEIVKAFFSHDVSLR